MVATLDSRAAIDDKMATLIFQLNPAHWVTGSSDRPIIPRKLVWICSSLI